MPADNDLLTALRPLADLAANSLTNESVEASLAAWRAFSLALMEYRSGNFANAESWCQRSLGYFNENSSRTANLQLLLAMIHFQVGKPELARSELAQVRRRIEDYFDQGQKIGNGQEGFWFDWVFARTLLRKAVGLIGESHRWK